MWPLIIVVQVIVSSVMTIVTRKLSLSNQRVFFVVGFFTYLVVALMGILYSIVFGVDLSYTPSIDDWKLIVPAAIGIVISWLVLYRTIALVGASNAVLITMANYIGSAVLGYTLLGESVSSTFLAGAALIIASMWIAFTVRPDTSHGSNAPMYVKVGLVITMMICFSFGMMFEKLAIDSMGVWEYARYGWPMQFVFASIFVAIVGRKELAHLDRATVKKALILGLFTSVAGGLYILALSLGTFSGTMLASSAKITLTSVLAYVFLQERNALGLRIIALAAAIAGMWLILG